MANIKSFLSSFDILTSSEIDDFVELTYPKTVKKGELLIEEGAIATEIGFVVSGVFRSYYHNTTEEEVTYCFTFENAFVGAYSSFISQTETPENIEALTDVTLLMAPRDKLLALEAKSVNWIKLSRFIAEREYLKMEQRVFMLQKETAESKYENLLKNHPEYLQAIPINYLSSYLGVTKRHLSRIRKALMEKDICPL